MFGGVYDLLDAVGVVEVDELVEVLEEGCEEFDVAVGFYDEEVGSVVVVGVGVFVWPCGCDCLVADSEDEDVVADFGGVAGSASDVFSFG